MNPMLTTIVRFYFLTIGGEELAQHMQMLVSAKKARVDVYEIVLSWRHYEFD